MTYFEAPREGKKKRQLDDFAQSGFVYPKEQQERDGLQFMKSQRVDVTKWTTPAHPHSPASKAGCLQHLFGPVGICCLVQSDALLVTCHLAYPCSSKIFVSSLKKDKGN